jgi:hypothetical protein
VFTGIDESKDENAREFWDATGLIENWNVPTDGRCVSHKVR